MQIYLQCSYYKLIWTSSRRIALLSTNCSHQSRGQALLLAPITALCCWVSNMDCVSQYITASIEYRILIAFLSISTLPLSIKYGLRLWRFLEYKNGSNQGFRPQDGRGQLIVSWICWVRRNQWRLRSIASPMIRWVSNIDRSDDSRSIVQWSRLQQFVDYWVNPTSTCSACKIVEYQKLIASSSLNAEK